MYFECYFKGRFLGTVKKKKLPPIAKQKIDRIVNGAKYGSHVFTIRKFCFISSSSPRNRYFLFLRNGRQEKAGKNILQIYLALVLIVESLSLTDLLIIGL